MTCFASSHCNYCMFTFDMLENLSLMFWNTDGLHCREGRSRLNKFDDPDIQSNLSKQHIICLVETHCSYSDTIDLPEFTCHMNIRPKSPSAHKFSRGIAVLIHDSIRRGITYMPITNSEYIWLKLNKKFFKMPHDLYLAVVYVCPQYSSYSHKSGDIFLLIERDIAHFSNDGSQFLICGDFNARTNISEDYCTSDNIDNFIKLPHAYIQDVPMPRHNMDTSSTNNHGEKLLDLCKGTGLRILNGRFLGDTLGHPTCYSPNGNPSTIDYMMLSHSALNMVCRFSVDNLTTSSIHCPLSLNIRTGGYMLDSVTEADLSPLPKYLWHKGDDEKFLQALNSSEIEANLSHLTNRLRSNTINNSDIDWACSAHNKVIEKAADQAGIKWCVLNKRRKTTPKQHYKNRKWYNAECRQLKSQSNSPARKI